MMMTKSRKEKEREMSFLLVIQYIERTYENDMFLKVWPSLKKCAKWKSENNNRLL